MSDLTSIEKLKLEKMFEMGGGYVLDFSNRTFQEFILDNLNIDIYSSSYDYQSGSKANRLRAFWSKEANSTVGELIEKLLEYWEAKKLINKQHISLDEQQLLNDCKKISERLRIGTAKKQIDNRDQFNSLRHGLLSQFEEFTKLTDPQDRKQRGYLLEGLLNQIFNLYKIPVRKSFKRNEGGEQIDGAFTLEGWYYLVECKWTTKPSDIRQLDSLYGKLDRSGKQTLGMFLSVNGWSENVCPLLKQNKEKSIILMDGFDLWCVLSDQYDVNLRELLLAKLDYLNFESQPFYSAKQYIEKSQNI